MIELIKVYKNFNHKKIMEDISLTISDGESVAIIGPSGCGKTTLLRTLIGLSRPTSGEVLVNGINIFGIKQKELDQVRLKFGLVFQYSALFDSLTVGENVAFSLREHSGLKESEIQKIIEEKLNLVGLPDSKNLYPDELSGGMKKRVGIARAMAHNPKIILYDEPTTGLDPVSSTIIEDLIIKVHREMQVTSILVTHQMNTVYRCCRRIVMLNGGRMIETGTPDETRNTQNEIVRKFIWGQL